MRKKIIYILGAIVLSIGVGVLAQTTFDLEELFFTTTGIETGDYAGLHFNFSGNNFAGMVFFGTGIDLYNQILELSGTTISCQKQINGFYINPARGNRMRPLDQNTLAILSGSSSFVGYGDILFTGGFFTDCTGAGISGDGIFGYIEHEYSGNTYNLWAGVEYDLSAGTATGIFDNTLTFITGANNTASGYIFDTYGGIANVYSGIVTTEEPEEESFDWDNDNFITGAFRDLNPSSGDVVAALYGTGIDDETAYTQNWSGYDGSCSVDNMEVEYINAGTDNIPENLSGNTIYVLESGAHIISYTGGIDMSGCNAIIGSGDVTMYSTGEITYRASKGFINQWGEKYGILDNININGTDNGIGGTHTGNDNGISFQHLENNTINNSNIYNNKNGIGMMGGSNNTISNCLIFNNLENGLKEYFGSNNQIDNIQVYNNGHNGIEFHASEKNTINNSQIYNNGKNGIIYWYGTGNVINNVQSYNNNNNGLAMISSVNNIFNNFQSYNNNDYGFNSDYFESDDRSTGNIFYGELKLFDNNLLDDPSGVNFYLTTGNDEFLTGGLTDDSAIAGLGRSDGVISTTGTMNCGWYTNPRNSLGEFLMNTGIYTECNIIGNIETWTSTGEVHYIYGSQILKQKTGVIYDISNDLVYSDLSYDDTKYIAEVNSLGTYLEQIDTTPPNVDLEYPNNGATITSNRINLQRTGSDNVGIEYYDLYLSGNGSTMSRNSIGGNPQIATPLSNGNYSWRVVATDTSENTGQTATWTFTISGNILGPTLISPVSGTNINIGELNLLWDQLYSVNSGYTRQISTNNTFGNIVASGSTNTTGATIIHHPNFMTGTFYWRVIDKKTAGVSEHRTVNIIDLMSGVDTQVEQFNFNTITGASLSQVYSSNTGIITGLTNNVSVLAKLENNIGALFVNNIMVGSQFLVKNGDEIKIELISKNAYNSGVSTKLIVGTGESLISGNFTVYTKTGTDVLDNSGRNLPYSLRIQAILFVDSLAEMYKYNPDKFANFLTTFQSILKDKSDLLANSISQSSNEQEIAFLNVQKLSVDYLKFVVDEYLSKIDYSKTNIYIAPNGKEYMVQFDDNRFAYTSPNFMYPKWFPTRELFKRHIDINNPGNYYFGTGDTITAPNNKKYIIYTENNKRTSNNFIYKKYFDTRDQIIEHIYINNPPATWDHNIDTNFNPVTYIAPNGKSYTIFKTASTGNNSNKYSSFMFLNPKYFSSLESAKNHINSENKK